MFDQSVYADRRAGLARGVGSGAILLLGNQESPRNYAAAAYPFRQDSSFLYCFGIERPGLAALIDVDEERETLFGDDPTVEQIVWTGRVPNLASEAQAVGVSEVLPAAALADRVAAIRRTGRVLHYLPPYRSENALRLSPWLGAAPATVAAGASPTLIRAVAAQRIVKGQEEVAEIERAVAASVAMHLAATARARPGVTEKQIACAILVTALEHGCELAYSTIATIHGEILHVQPTDTPLASGSLLLVDAGAESARHYAADLSSTVPVGGRFTDRQRDVAAIVLRAYDAAAGMLAPGVHFRDVHLRASLLLAQGLRDLGIVRGDPADAVARGAHALFFPCGTGHLLGLDVHDMEDLGEEHVGYVGEPRSRQFGLAALRLCRPLEPGFTLTVEPGLYFIPELIDRWHAEGRLRDAISYDRLEAWRDFGGYRFEEDPLVTANGARRLGPALPRSPESSGPATRTA